jgi:pyridoxal phosphate enzyme (YggS family)
VNIIQARYDQILARIDHAARTVGRDPECIRLVVVTKRQPVEVIRQAIDAGARYLGENYADEALAKKNALRSGPPARLQDIQWHIIGHVQSRKARLVGEQFDYLHSLDSLKLAQKLDRICTDINRTLPVLLEMNVSGEETKSGWAAWDKALWGNLLPDLNAIIGLPSLKVRGLMTMAPFCENPEDTRPYFRRLCELQEFLSNQYPRVDWRELSMGMSGDFEVAVQEGATWVRIGQAILGPRPGNTGD